VIWKISKQSILEETIEFKQKKIELILSFLSSINLSIPQIDIFSFGPVDPRIYLEVMTSFKEAIMDDDLHIQLVMVYQQLDSLVKRNKGELSQCDRWRRYHLLCVLFRYYSHQVYSHGPFKDEHLNQLSSFPRLLAIMNYSQCYVFTHRKLFELFLQQDIIREVVSNFVETESGFLMAGLANSKVLKVFKDRLGSSNYNQHDKWILKINLILFISMIRMDPQNLIKDSK
jgi:hypothetical protein